MSPERVNQIKNDRLSYEQMKSQQIKNFTKLVFTIRLGVYIKNQTIKIHHQRFKAIKIQILCIQFIKLLKNKLRVKITEKTRLRMNILHNLKMMPQMIKHGAVKKAKKIITEALMPYMEFRGLQEITANSQEYMQGLKKIQKFLRMKRDNFRQRIRIMI